MRKIAVALVSLGIVVYGCEKKEEKTHSEEAKTQTVVVEKKEEAKQPAVEEKKEETQQAEVEKQTVEKEEEVKQKESDGKSLFVAKGCSACHQPSAEGVGPSLKRISQAYKDNKEGLIQFLKGNGKAIVDPQKFNIMAPQLNATKAMTDEELSKMADYILEH
ncbi:c-type cytochrome [Persephonella sp.]